MKFVIIALAVLVFIAVSLLVFGAVGFKMSCVSNRNKKPPTDEKRIKRIEIRKKNNAYFYSHNPEDLAIKTPDGLTLRAWYSPAEKQTKRFVIAIHGHNCNGPDECAHLYPFYHNDLGYNFLLPDLRGHGRSDGNLIGFSGLDYKDIKLWMDYLVERFGEDIEIMLHGISMGAATSMMVNNTNPREQLRLIVEDCGFTNAFEEVAVTTSNMLGGIKVDRLVNLFNIYCRLIAKYDLKKDADPLGTMKNAKNPVLFVHGEEDTFVPFPMCQRLYDACPVEKDIFTVPGAIHAYSYYDARDEYNEKVRAFIEKYWDKNRVSK
ncbi:MAG: alpha/beta hydrolase [Clostridia bacterium]|nr:alpha/beta hydrolase [Clostridia bacterium]